MSFGARHRAGAARCALAAAICAASIAALGGCQKLLGLQDAPTPLAVVHVRVEGTSAIAPANAAAPLRLRVALIWGAQWLPEPLCVLPPDSPAAASVIAAGCPDSFRFVPNREEVSADVGDPRDVQLPLYALPPTDVMIGAITARVVYGSLVLYDDRNGNGTLDLTRPPRRIGSNTVSRSDGGTASSDAGAASNDGAPSDGGGDAEPVVPGPRDVVYAASFVSMTQPDLRVAYREGAFDTFAAYYPRSGCADPPRGFSVLGAGGFSATDAIAAALSGKLPAQDPATCTQQHLADATVVLHVGAPSKLQGVACRARYGTGPRYREPPGSALPLDDLTWACAPLSTIGVGPEPLPIVQLIVATPASDACRDVIHYTLRGCRHDASCKTPDWDLTRNPPAWWPCPATH